MAQAQYFEYLNTNAAWTFDGSWAASSSSYYGTATSSARVMISSTLNGTATLVIPPLVVGGNTYQARSIFINSIKDCTAAGSYSVTLQNAGLGPNPITWCSSGVLGSFATTSVNQATTPTYYAAVPICIAKNLPPFQTTLKIIVSEGAKNVFIDSVIVLYGPKGTPSAGVLGMDGDSWTALGNALTGNQSTAWTNRLAARIMSHTGQPVSLVNNAAGGSVLFRNAANLGVMYRVLTLMTPVQPQWFVVNVGINDLSWPNGSFPYNAGDWSWLFHCLCTLVDELFDTSLCKVVICTPCWSGTANQMGRGAGGGGGNTTNPIGQGTRITTMARNMTLDIALLFPNFGVADMYAAFDRQWQLLAANAVPDTGLHYTEHAAGVLAHEAFNAIMGVNSPARRLPITPGGNVR